MIEGSRVLESEALWWRLTGACFHKLDGGEIEYQGRVEEVIDDDLLRVRYFDWLVGCENAETVTVCRLELEHYRFYESDAAMRAAHNSTMRRDDHAIDCRKREAAGPPPAAPGPGAGAD